MSPDKRRDVALASSQDAHVVECSLGQKFMSNKKEQYYRVRYEWEFSNFLSSSKSELSKIHKVYPSDYVERDITTQDKMWRSVLHLQDVIFDNGEQQWSTYRRGKLMRDLHDYFFQLATRRFISRSNFECCVLKASRGNRHATANDEEELVIALDSVYNSFDVLCKEAFDWRRFLFYFHFTSDPRKSAKDQLLSAFAKIGKKSCIELQDLGLVLFPLVKADATTYILEVLDEAWAQVKASRQEIDENLGSTKVTIEMFQQMLELKGLQRFFDQSTSPWGRGRIFPVNICQWEEEFYNETSLQLVRVSRRSETISDKLDRDNCRTKLCMWRQWLDYAKYQGSLRFILNKINHRIDMRRKSRGLLAFSQWAMRDHSALEIQRVGRGFLGRIVARNRWMVFTSATMIQTHFRMYLARKQLNILSSMYHWAIVEVQRNIRGALARRLALKKLLTLVEQEHLRNVKERERLEMERGVWYLTKLQGLWRRKMASAKILELRRKRQREIQLQRAMETERNLFLRERQIYERQLEGYYKSMKEEHDNSNQVQSRIAHDQIKVRTDRKSVV